MSFIRMTSRWRHL